MNEQQYKDRKHSLMTRLYCALDAKCYRVARARIKELSQLSHDFTGADKDVVFKALMKHHGLDKYFRSHPDL